MTPIQLTSRVFRPLCNALGQHFVDVTKLSPESPRILTACSHTNQSCMHAAPAPHAGSRLSSKACTSAARCSGVGPSFVSAFTSAPFEASRPHGAAQLDWPLGEHLALILEIGCGVH